MRRGSGSATSRSCPKSCSDSPTLAGGSNSQSARMAFSLRVCRPRATLSGDHPRRAGPDRPAPTAGQPTAAGRCDGRRAVVRALPRKGRPYEQAVKTLNLNTLVQEPNEGAREAVRQTAERSMRAAERAMATKVWTSMSSVTSSSGVRYSRISLRCASRFTSSRLEPDLNRWNAASRSMPGIYNNKY